MTSKKKALSKTRKSSSTRSTGAARARINLAAEPKPSRSSPPSRIFAQASPRSLGGVSMFEGQDRIDSRTVRNFVSEREVVNEATARLREHGFEVLQITPLSINIAGTAETYRRAFNTDIVVLDKPVMKERGRVDVAQFLDCPSTQLPGLIETRGTRFEDVLEGVALEEPVYFMAAPSMFPPAKAYWHLRVPADISLGCNADRAHRAGVTGKGIRVAMVDTGWYKHPFFTARGYRAAPVVLGPAATLPLRDESGHGTGESANIFANAPDVELLPVKMSFVNSIGAFNAAVALNPHVITCSWGSDLRSGPLSAANQALAAAVAAAVASGITVIFSAGNGHHGFPGQHPDVISAGGVFMNVDESLRASDYASGFMSNIYSGRRAPDVSGLVGMKPKAAYIMLPLEPGDQIDSGNAGSTHPNGDETSGSDGWAAFSGTSASAPQLAGVAALIKQAFPAAKPADVRDIMRKTARDVKVGNCNTAASNATATAGPDTATGDGLVDAHKAVVLAKVRALMVPGVVTPTAQPALQPLVTAHASGYAQPLMSLSPMSAAATRGKRNEAGTVDLGMGAGWDAAGASPPGVGQLTPEDVETIENLLVNSHLKG